MSSPPNPYAPSPLAEPVPERVAVRPIQLLLRALEAIRGEFWLFLGISVVGILVASLVPFGLLAGPMMVGMFLCFAQRQETGRTEFGTLFKGFDQFMEAFVATLIMTALALVILLPLIAVFLVTLFAVIAAQQNGAEPDLWIVSSLFAFYPLILIASIAIYVPFIFTFQLIADRKVSAGVAVRASARAAWYNLGGVVWFLIAIGFISILAALPCCIPAILLLPLTIGAMWLFYQDVFGTACSASIEPGPSQLT